MRLIDTGGFSTVWQTLFQGKIVVVKQLKGQKKHENFIAEIKILELIKNNSIEEDFVNILGINSEEKWIIMEEIEGEKIEKGNSSWEVLEVGLKLSELLCQLHRVGIIHCDLKPHNIIKQPDGKLRIIDFGISLLEGQKYNKKGTL